MSDFEARFGAGQDDLIKSEARAAARRRAAADRRIEAMQTRPDRIAMWAFLMAIFVTLAAAASSKAGSGGISTEPDESGKPKGEMTKSIATYYGPGLWGNTTACGQTLKRKTVGVAHKKLPCGTEVTIAYRGKVATAEVIDRGPFANDATWDLTQALADQLDFTATDEIRTSVAGKNR